MREEIYDKLLITWYPFAERAELYFGGKRPSKEEYKRNLISYGTGAIYIMDPLNIFHTETGNIIFTSGEIVEYKAEKIKKFIILRCSKRDIEIRRSKIFPSGAFENSIPGTVYKTNKRLIYLQDPPPFYHSRFILEIPEWVRDRKLRKASRKICVSIPLSLVVAHEWKLRKTIKLYISTDGAGYMAIIRHGKPEMIEELLRKGE